MSQGDGDTRFFVDTTEGIDFIEGHFVDACPIEDHPDGGGQLLIKYEDYYGHIQEITCYDYVLADAEQYEMYRFLRSASGDPL